MKKLKKYLITGLIITLPIILSFYLLVVLFRFLDSILGKYLNIYLQKILGFYIPGVGLVLSLILIILIGFFAMHFLGRRIRSNLENLLLKIPFMKNIYPVTKEIVRFFISQENRIKFSRVVLVRCPDKDSWAIGFITNEGWEEVNKKTGRELVIVYIPWAPGPFSGFCVLLPKENVIPLDISSEEALKLIVSGGVVAPGNNKAS